MVCGFSLPSLPSMELPSLTSHGCPRRTPATRVGFVDPFGGCLDGYALEPVVAYHRSEDWKATEWSRTPHLTKTKDWVCSWIPSCSSKEGDLVGDSAVVGDLVAVGRVEEDGSWLPAHCHSTASSLTSVEPARSPSTGRALSSMEIVSELRGLAARAPP